VSGELPQYGITTATGAPVIIPDSVLKFDVRAGSTINSHPVELGGFSAYNRVQSAIPIRMQLVCTGKKMSRQAFLSTLKSLRNGTQIVTISSPDASYPNMVLREYGYEQTAEHGAVTIWADTQWEEERSTNVAVSTPATAQPQGAATTDGGTLQPIAVTAQQMATINNPPIPPANLPSTYFFTAPPSGAAF
jgi:hypothetical protein